MNHKLAYLSSYDRGAEHLLKMWPTIIEKYPDTELHICYGWDLYDKAFTGNPERMMWKDKMNKLMTQKGITHHGRLGKEELEKVRKNCTIWAYPTHFAEINCITALECQKDGVVPVTMDDFALRETVGSGIKVEGDIYDTETQEAYLKALFSLMDDEKKWKEESEKGKEFIKDYSWGTIARKWEMFL